MQCSENRGDSSSTALFSSAPSCSLPSLPPFSSAATLPSAITRLELCALCGIEQTYRETCILDQVVFRLISQYETGVSKVLVTVGKRCGHNFHTVQDRMTHFSFPRSPKLIRREAGNDYGPDVLAHATYIAALASIHATNSESSQVILHKTCRHFVENHTNAITQLRATLAYNSLASTKAFRITNRYFRPVRPDPERWFNSLR